MQVQKPARLATWWCALWPIFLCFSLQLFADSAAPAPAEPSGLILSHFSKIGDDYVYFDLDSGEVGEIDWSQIGVCAEDIQEIAAHSSEKNLFLMFNVFEVTSGDVSADFPMTRLLNSNTREGSTIRELGGPPICTAWFGSDGRSVFGILREEKSLVECSVHGGKWRAVPVTGLGDAGPILEGWPSPNGTRILLRVEQPPNLYGLLLCTYDGKTVQVDKQVSFPGVGLKWGSITAWLDNESVVFISEVSGNRDPNEPFDWDKHSDEDLYLWRGNLRTWEAEKVFAEPLPPRSSSCGVLAPGKNAVLITVGEMEAWYVAHLDRKCLQKVAQFSKVYLSMPLLWLPDRKTVDFLLKPDPHLAEIHNISRVRE